MSGYLLSNKNEIDTFIIKYFINDLTTIAEKWFAIKDNTKNISTKIKEPDNVELKNSEYKYATNITIIGDTLDFEAAMLCSVSLYKCVNDHDYSISTNQWLFLHCQVIIDNPTMTFKVISGSIGSTGKSKRIGYAVDNNLVPYIKKDNLEHEATRFLEEYYPEALETPMPVPIMDIIRYNMGLGVRLGGLLSEKNGVFGQVCFSDIEVTQVCFKTGEEIERTAPRGTIIVDIRTLKRNEGCVNNTLAHEAFHWYRHRVYGTIREMLYGEKYIACRRKKNISYSNAQYVPKRWTDEERIEWQANSIAPRILMPLKTFKMKIEELYDQYDYHNQTPVDNDNTLIIIIIELSRFFQVSKQSAKIRMIDLGYSEAANVYNYDEYIKQNNDIFTEITKEDAFREYRENNEFRKALDSGRFRYVENQFIIDHEYYVKHDGFGEYTLTDHAHKNLSECALQFYTTKEYPDIGIKNPSGVVYRTDNSKAVSRKHYNYEVSESIIDNAEALQKLQQSFNDKYEDNLSVSQTFAQTAKTLMERKKWNSVIFKEKTLLDDSMYSRIMKNERNPSFRTAIAICVGLGVDAITASNMLAGAGYSFSPSKEHQAFSYILSALHGKSIDECNAFLESISIKPLGNREVIN